MKVARSTGGKAYDMTSLEKLESIWDDVGEDLKRQFLVVYQPATVDREWQSIEVFDDRKRLRAPSGLAVVSEKPGEKQ